MSLSVTDNLNIIGYYGEMELSAAEKKVRIVMAKQLQGTVSKYYDTVRAILADEKVSKRKRDILLAAAVMSLKNAYLSIFDKYYPVYINAVGAANGEPYYGVDAWRQKRALDFAIWITQTARNEPNLAFSQSHAATVTRTEVNSIGNLAAMDAAYRQGKRFKTWKTFGDRQVRPTHQAANGTRIPIDEAFTVGDYKMMFPTDSSLGAGAEEIVNCRCVLEFDDGKSLTNRNERGIIRVRGDNVALENQRYGRNKNTLVNKSYIESGEYRNKFDKISDNKKVSRVLYAKAKEMLNHRSGTKIEDMYWIDGKTGEIVACALDEKNESAVLYTESINKAISGKSNLIAMHTHPQSMPPSDADFNSVFKYGYSKALVLCHDGKVFQYTAHEPINGTLYDMYVQEFFSSGLSKFDAQIKALEKIKENCDIDFWEVK